MTGLGSFWVSLQPNAPDDCGSDREPQQARELVPASEGFLCARTRHGGQVARHEADGQEREQGDPVLRVGNRQRADRGKKKKLKQSIATTDVTTATHRRDVAATTRTTIRNVVETVAAFETCSHFT